MKEEEEEERHGTQVYCTGWKAVSFEVTRTSRPDDREEIEICDDCADEISVSLNGELFGLVSWVYERREISSPLVGATLVHWLRGCVQVKSRACSFCLLEHEGRPGEDRRKRYFFIVEGQFGKTLSGWGTERKDQERVQDIGTSFVLLLVWWKSDCVLSCANEKATFFRCKLHNSERFLSFRKKRMISSEI